MQKYISKYLRKFKRWLAFSPPGGLTSQGWRSFNDEFKRLAPIRFWLHRDFKRIFVYPIKWKYEAIDDWIRYRTIAKYHIVETGLQPGYNELSNIMLHANFNMLKDFVEVQLAYRSYWADDTDTKSWCEKHMPMYYQFYEFRKPALGIKHLEWAATLDDPTLPVFEQSPDQAISARETLKLYKWWVEDRPERKPVEIRYPPHDISSVGFNSSNRNTAEYKIYRDDLDKSFNQGADWDQEDDRMLVRLMNIRRSMWS